MDSYFDGKCLHEAQPCPNCGDKYLDILSETPELGRPGGMDGRLIRVHCPACGLTGPFSPSRAEAVKAWNSITCQKEAR